MFELGQVVATPGALALLESKGVTPMELIQRHVSGDWGDLGTEDKQANVDAIKHGGRVFSSYVIDGEKFWVITEADRSSTCVLLPEEY